MVEQLDIRGDGKKSIILVEAENLAEATHKAIISCHDYGSRIETPKQKPGMTLGYDANMLIRVRNPDSEPKVCYPGIHDDARGVMQYILEVTHGIHNHWKKSEEQPEQWGYTYNERFVPQLPFVFQRIEHDWKEKKRISGRDYQFAIWIAGEDIILEQEDAPCFQLGQLRFLNNSDGKIVMNYETDWRSRDLLKAWNENNIGQVELMKLMAKKVSSIIDEEVKLGSYIDHSSSLHLYGLYVDRDNLPKQIERMKKKGYEALSCSLDDFFVNTGGKDKKSLMRLIAAQIDAEAKGHGLNQPEGTLEKLGYDLATYEYPKEWDSWPKQWDIKPNKDSLAQVYTKDMIIDKGRTFGGYFENEEIRTRARELGNVYSDREIIKMAYEITSRKQHEREVFDSGNKPFD